MYIQGVLKVSTVRLYSRSKENAGNECLGRNPCSSGLLESVWWQLPTFWDKLPIPLTGRLSGNVGN